MSRDFRAEPATRILLRSARMRIERKRGYRQPKYLAAIQLADGYGHIAGGNGGYWEDRNYDWYGGI